MRPKVCMTRNTPRPFSGQPNVEGRVNALSVGPKGRANDGRAGTSGPARFGLRRLHGKGFFLDPMVGPVRLDRAKDHISWKFAGDFGPRPLSHALKLCDREPCRDLSRTTSTC